MERLEAQAQHLGARREYSRPTTHTEFRARRGKAARSQKRTRALPRRASTQRLRRATSASRQTQGRSPQGVWENRSHHYYEPTCKKARFYQIKRKQNPYSTSTTCGSSRGSSGAGIPCSGSGSS